MIYILAANNVGKLIQDAGELVGLESRVHEPISDVTVAASAFM